MLAFICTYMCATVAVVVDSRLEVVVAREFEVAEIQCGEMR